MQTMPIEPIMPITADSLVKEVVECHPQTIAVFAKHGLNCVGCYISPFHTISDTAREYELWLEPLLSELNGAVKQDV
jgi:hybrid cluster-associated redox disulfide protein